MFESSTGNYYQTSQDDGFLDYAVPIGIALGAGIISGGAASALTGGLTAGLSSTAAGAINGVLGSAISQGITTGGIDPSSLLTAAIIGGIGGFADGLNNYDNVNMPGGFAGDMDSAIGDLAGMLGMNQTDTIALLEGVATGVVSGDDLESIALGVVGTLGQQQIMDMLKKSFGETLDVQDWFKDGASHIPVDALQPIVGGVINAAINGGMSTEDALNMAFDYFKAGGDIDFALPGVPDAFQEWLDGIPGLDFEKGDGWDIIQDENGDYTVQWYLPSFDFNFGDGTPGELPQLGNPCTTAEGQEGKIFAGALEGSFICEGIDIDPFGCGEGETWDELLGNCVPDVVECMEGFDWDGQTCVPIPEGGGIDPFGCGEGETWDELLGNCVPDVVECMEGFEWDGQTCVKIPDVVECIEGFEWDGQTCVEIPDVVECIEGFEWDGQTCVEIPDLVECMEGWEWSDLYGECVEKINDDFTCPEGFRNENGECLQIETSCPEGFQDVDGECLQIDIPNPCADGEVLDEAGLCSPASGEPSEGGDFTATWNWNPTYTTINTPQASKYAPKKPKGMFS